MSEADDKLNICRRCLGEIGTRSTINSLDPLDGSQEAYYCSLFFEDTRDMLLRAAHWGFAGLSDRPPLWKAAPGTPENPTAGQGWNSRNPQPPWLYSYVFSEAIIQIRRVRESIRSASTEEVMFGSVSNTDSFSVCVPFETGLDYYDRGGNALTNTQTIVTSTLAAAGTGYRPGDDILLVGNDASLMGQPVTVRVTGVNTGGGVTHYLLGDGGTFSGPISSLTQSATSGSGTGFSLAVATLGPRGQFQKIIHTNARDMVMDFTTHYTEIRYWDAGFQSAFRSAFGAKLVLALLGDRALYAAKLQEANAAIIEARVRDGNEGLTVYEHVPDWLLVRGVSAPPSSWYTAPYGPLFAV